jgi:uncharacterized protein YqeY
MSLITEINKDFMDAYKSKEMEKKDFLGVLKTEITKESKTPEDSSVIAKIKSMIKSAESTNSLSEMELDILNRYLPQQMSEETLTSEIENIITTEGLTGMKDMGKVMTELKTNFDGQYDGKLASTITRNLLN